MKDRNPQNYGHCHRNHHAAAAQIADDGHWSHSRLVWQQHAAHFLAYGREEIAVSEEMCVRKER